MLVERPLVSAHDVGGQALGILPRRAAGNDRVGRYVGGDHSSGGDDSAAPHAHAAEDAGAGPLVTLVSVTANDPRENVVYLGYIPVEDVHVQLAGCDFLVTPSQCYEAFGVVMIEAFAHGVPVPASRLGSMAEIVEDGVTGLLFDPGNARDLAAKATWLGDHPRERREMGAAARRVYEREYALDKNYARLTEIYGEARDSATERGDECRRRRPPR